MKILIIGNGALSKYENKYLINKHTAHFCEKLYDNNIEVGFLQFENEIKKDEGLQDYELKSFIKVHTVKNKINSKINKIISYIKISLLLIKTIKDYDFIYIFYPGHIPKIASILSIILGKNFALYVRGIFDIESKINKFIVKKSNFILTVSDLIKNNLISLNKNIDVIAPMIDFSKDDILLTKERNNKPLNCLFVGRIEYAKGIFELVEAIKLINKKHNHLAFNIVGGGDSLDKIRELSKDIKNINILGQISDKNELLNKYREADIFIFPSHFEGFPRVLYEAMMSRVAVITTLVGGIGGLMKNEYNCLSIDVKKPHSIEKAVDKLIKDDELKNSIINQATLDMQELFSGKKKPHSEILTEKLKEL